MQETLGNLKETVESIREARKYRLPEDLEIELYEEEENMRSPHRRLPPRQIPVRLEVFPEKKEETEEEE